MPFLCPAFLVKKTVSLSSRNDRDISSTDHLWAHEKANVPLRVTQKSFSLYRTAWACVTQNCFVRSAGKKEMKILLREWKLTEMSISILATKIVISLANIYPKYKLESFISLFVIL